MATVKRLIDANKLIRFCQLVKKEDEPSEECCTALDLVIELLKQAPAVDAVEVVHAEWAHLGGDEWCCTACGEVITTEGSWEKPTKKYCNECGARMDGGNEDL